MKGRLIAIAMLIAVVCYAQPTPDTLWTLQLDGYYEDWAYSVRPTSDGGYIAAGRTAHPVGDPTWMYIVKTDSNGDTLWTRTHDWGASRSIAYDVQEAHDGGYIIAGMCYSSGPSACLVKMDTLGNVMWSQTYGNGVAYSLQKIPGGGYVFAGNTTGQDFLLVKIDNIGNTQFSRTYGGSENDVAKCVQMTSDGGYILAGYTLSFGAGENDWYVVKTDSNGNYQWSLTFGWMMYDRANCVVETPDGGYLIGGYAGPYPSFQHYYYIVKTNSIGDTLWTRAVRASSTNYNGIETIEMTSDENYIITGMVDYSGFNREMYLAKINETGDILWDRHYGGTNNEYGHFATQTTDGGYIIAGRTLSFGAIGYDFYLVKTGPENRCTVIKPNGGEEWSILQQDTVQWTSHGFESDVSIELNRYYPNGSWEMLVDSTDNDGEELVFVTGPPSDSCRVRVSSLENPHFDISDSNFSIVSSLGYLALITLASPEVPVLSWDAGIAECPQTISGMYYLKNFGNESIVIYPPALSINDHFMLISDCDTLNLSPEEVSACSLTITFNPLQNGTHRDTLLIMTDAVNTVGGYVRIPMQGKQISTPQTPAIVINIEGDDARLTWDQITESILGCSVDVTGYLLFYSEILEGPYYFLDFTPDTSYVHTWVVRFASNMFYEGLAYVGELDVLNEILASGRVLTRKEVHAVLGRVD